jgi:HK97 gp10 family phage protein
MGIRWVNRQKFFDQLVSVIPEAVKEMEFANSKSADLFVALAKSLAPGPKSGALLNSIQKKPGRRKGSFIVSAGGPTTTVTSPRGEYDYSLAQEYGTEHNGRHPFFWPAFRVNKRPTRDRVRRALVKAIKAKGF